MFDMGTADRPGKGRLGEPVTVFIASTPYTRPSGISGDAKSAATTVRDAARRCAPLLDPDVARPVRLLTSRLAPADVAAAIGRSVRRGLVDRADACVALLEGAGFDCGCEVELAFRLGVPTLLLYPRTSTPPLHAGGMPADACCELRSYGSSAELDEIVSDWMTRNGAAILAGPIRRNRPHAVTEPTRIMCRRKWWSAQLGERRRVAVALQVSEQRVASILADAREFAAAPTSLTLDLAGQLGVSLAQPAIARHERRRHAELPAVLDAALPLDDAFMVLPKASRKGLRDAVDTWDWDESTTRRALELGLRRLRHDREVLTAGSRQRSSSLSNRFAWKRLLDRDAS